MFPAPLDHEVVNQHFAFSDSIVIKTCYNFVVDKLRKLLKTMHLPLFCSVTGELLYLKTKATFWSHWKVL